MLTLSAPSFYTLELTPACNNACPGCSNVFGLEQVPLMAGRWREILTQVSPQVQQLRVSGGEPTLHPEFRAIIQVLQDLTLQFTLFTNGRWPNPQALIALLRATPQCSGLLVSLQGPDAAAHEAFTNTSDSFKETCANIRRAAEAGLRVHTSTVLTMHNWDRVAEVAALAQGMGARRAVFNRFLGPPRSDLEPEEWQLRRAIDDIESLRHQASRSRSPTIGVKYGNCIPQCFGQSSSTGCWAGVAYATIDPWGNLRPCNHSPLVIGNVLDTPIDALWQSEAMNCWRDLLPAECERCGALSICHGGCRAMIEIRGLAKDPLAGDPLPTLDHPAHEITLWQRARPRALYLIQPEHFGYVLIRGQHLVPVTSQAKPILDTFDGQTSLSEIQALFGQDALNLVGSLYIQGMIELR